MGDSIGSAVDLAQQQRDKQLDANIARVKEAGAEEQALADKAAQQQIDLATRFTDSQQPFTQEPPHEQIQNIMAGAPWMMALVALGGAAGKLSGQAMMDGLNGVSDGIIKGDAEGMEQSWKRYEAEFQKWNARAEQQMRIYNVLSQAYGSANDAKMKAMAAAHAMTNDAYAAKTQADDPMARLKMISELQLSNARAAEAYAKAKQTKDMGGFGDPRIQDLQAAFSEKQVTLPAGLRSKDQQLSTFRGILARHPDMTSDEIADLYARNKKQFAADMKAIQRAGGIAGGVAVGQEEIKAFGPLILQASAAVPRGSFMPINRLMTASEASLGDPNLRKLKIYINAMLNAYDQTASRGGTDQNKRAEAHALLTAADSPEALAAGVEAFKVEADTAEAAAEAAEARLGGTGASSPTKTVKFNDLPP